jgi:hypothetical protein
VKPACEEPHNDALERTKSAPAREPRPSPLNAVFGGHSRAGGTAVETMHE